MNTRWIAFTALAAAVACAPAWGAAQTATKGGGKASSDTAAKLPSSDRKFVETAARDNRAEVELGKLASERAASDSVKQFGKRMSEDHGKAEDELNKIAQDKGVTPPADLDRSHARLRDKLSKLSGAEFDRAYVDEMVKEHRKDVKAFQREADKAKDPEVKSFASKTLPTLQDHLKMAEQLQTEVRGTAKK